MRWYIVFTTIYIYIYIIWLHICETHFIPPASIIRLTAANTFCTVHRRRFYGWYWMQRKSCYEMCGTPVNNIWRNMCPPCRLLGAIIIESSHSSANVAIVMREIIRTPHVAIITREIIRTPHILLMSRAACVNILLKKWYILLLIVILLYLYKVRWYS